MPNAFIIIGPQLKKCHTEVITKAVVLRNVDNTAAVIFNPSKHPQYASTPLSIYASVSTHKFRKVVIRLCKGK